MGKWNILRERILLGDSDANIDFGDLCHLLRRWGFGEGISGSHHIFSRSEIEEIFKIQPEGRMTKSYQVAQIRDMILKYRIGEQLNDWVEIRNDYILERTGQSVPGRSSGIARLRGRRRNTGRSDQNVNEVIRLWIETARNMGREIPKPRGRLAYA